MRDMKVMAEKSHSPVRFGPYDKFPVSSCINMHEFKNIDDVWGLQAIVCNRTVAFFIQHPVRNVN